VTAPLLEVRDLKTHFRSDGGVVKAVDGVSFDVRAGETMAIVGESGSGKSVTALSIMRLIQSPPGKIIGGEIDFEGRDLLGMSEGEMRDVRGNKVAMIFQEPMTSLNPTLTIGRQVGEPLEVHDGATAKTVREKCLSLLRKVRIPDPESRIDAYPHQFSGGMRQRAMIAMSLACEPQLIIADEPTTALDVTVQAQVLHLLKSLTRETNAALMLITHDLGVVARYADRVNVMYAGRIVESGTARGIYNNPRHPYTVGLMNSMPRLDEQAKESLEPIEGQPPDLANLPPGCPFQPRCRFASERCAKERPDLVSVEGDHTAACWVDIHAAT
jgi:oligopeptide/dipeptide ABC transporter ATP-binding protein